MVFEGTTGAFDRTYRFNSKFQFLSKKEREICEFETDLNNFFCLRSNLSNDNIISA